MKINIKKKCLGCHADLPIVVQFIYYKNVTNRSNKLYEGHYLESRYVILVYGRVILSFYSEIRMSQRKSIS